MNDLRLKALASSPAATALLLRFAQNDICKMA